MGTSFHIGSTVTLTEAVRRVNAAPEKYQIGKVVEVGSWNIYQVLWNGFDHPISMRGDEIMEVEA